jgi:hypothetical protein
MLGIDSLLPAPASPTLTKTNRWPAKPICRIERVRHPVNKFEIYRCLRQQRSTHGPPVVGLDAKIPAGAPPLWHSDSSRCKTEPLE